MTNTKTATKKPSPDEILQFICRLARAEERLSRSPDSPVLRSNVQQIRADMRALGLSVYL